MRARAREREAERVGEYHVDAGVRERDNHVDGGVRERDTLRDTQRERLSETHQERDCEGRT